MSETKLTEAKREIDDSLVLCKFCMRFIGLSFEEPKRKWSYIGQKLVFISSVLGICYHVFSEIVFMGLLFAASPEVEDVVPLFLGFGYGTLSIAKVFALWYKKAVFSKLLQELAEIWPTSPLSDNARNLKNTRLGALRVVHRWYFMINIVGVWFYNLTPIGLYFYRRLWQGLDPSIGFIWASWYPFDKHKPLAHVLVYAFEMFAGNTCVWIMVSTDLLFSGMASHIGMLLRLLQQRLEGLATTDKSQQEYYQDIVDNIKLHHRLIRYCSDLEQAFSMANLVNIVLSSINICCAAFVIVLLEPFMVASSKLFLISALIQTGMLCGYADDIFHANADVATAAYNSGWYRMDSRCRGALLFLIQRSQKPIAFTAMKFTIITLVTYSGILTRSYSYFTLLYTMYSEN